ncbi:unnamed protein product [Rhizophagus irregularis]|nr:unnamed protein product [Rhizophagus irregularis]
MPYFRVSLASGYSFDKIDIKYSILVGFYTVFVIGGILQATSTIFAQIINPKLTQKKFVDVWYLFNNNRFTIGIAISFGSIMLHPYQ